MSPYEEPILTSTEVLNRVRSEIDAPSSAQAGSAVAARVARIRAMQRDYRIEPLGGRLLPVKRLAHWFVASTFDRQAKVVEALFDLVRDVGDETEQLRTEVRQLKTEMDELRSTADGSGESVKS